MGIGRVVEGTTIYAMRKNRADEDLTEMIKTFIDPETGIGFNMFRIGIGLSDFSDRREFNSFTRVLYLTGRFREAISDNHRRALFHGRLTSKVCMNIEVANEC